MNCIKCSKSLPNIARFCGGCGIQVYWPASNSSGNDSNDQDKTLFASPHSESISKLIEVRDFNLFPSEDFIRSDDFKKLIGHKHSYYAASFLLLAPKLSEANLFEKIPPPHKFNFDSFKKSNKIYSSIIYSSKFNWHAAFFGYLWLAYRRCHKMAAMALLMNILAFSFVAINVGSNPSISILVLFLINFIIFGKLGNIIYMKDLEKRLSRKESLVGFVEVGGVNFFAIVWFMLLAILIGVLNDSMLT